MQIFIECDVVAIQGVLWQIGTKHIAHPVQLRKVIAQYIASPFQM